jgi:hypothetical protein
MRLDKVLITIAFVIVLFGLFAPVKADTNLVLDFQYCQGTTCRTQVLPVPEDVGVLSCMKQGMIAAVTWIRENKPEGWKLGRWYCGALTADL